MRLSNFSYFVLILFCLVILLSLKKTFAATALATSSPTTATTPPTTAASATATTQQSATTPDPNAPQATSAKDHEDDTQKDLEHQVIRRLIVFPFDTHGDFRREADISWWKVREFLSDQQRFLVGTKRFMEQQDVFQPRKALRIGDVTLLSKALDSDCLITTYIDTHRMYMQAYSAQDGQLLWKNSIDFVTSRPVSTQLENLSLKLAQDFLASVPYQGFQIVDPLNQAPLIEEGETIMAKVDVGAKSTATPGEKVQWITIQRTSTLPLFQGGAQIRVIAEGDVLKNENQVLTVEVKRAKDLKLLDKKSLILIPEENKKLYNMYAIRHQEHIEANLNLLSEPMVDAKEKNEESKPLLVALTSIANIVVAVLLAF